MIFHINIANFTNDLIYSLYNGHVKVALRILAFLTLEVRQSRCRKRVTDGVGKVLTTMLGSKMRHLVKILLQLENVAQVKLKRKGFVITSIHCYTGMYPQGRPVRPRSHLNFQIP